MVFSTSIRYVLLLLAFQFVFQITHAFWLNQPKFGTQFSGRSVGCRNNKVFARFSSQKAISSAPKKLPTNKDEKAELIDMLLRLIQEDGLDHGEEDSGVNNQNKMLNSVLRISCTHSEPNFGMPWQRQKQESSTSSGFVISNRRIITNAHSVEYGSLIQVKKRESEKKFLANVVAVGHECDLAMLSVDDDEFWEGLEPLTMGSVPELLDDVSVVGFPIGGDSISISSGVVSRIEMQEYAQATAELLAIQIDAAINPGNSGGPVVNVNNELIGVAFQSLSASDVENIGHVVPITVLNHFLDAIERNGKYDGVCSLGIRLQGMENADIRRHYGMFVKSIKGDHYGLKGAETGVLVVNIAPLSPAAEILKKGDVILSINGIKIANDGTIPFREGNFHERVGMHYLTSMGFPSDVMKLEILRNKTIENVDVQLWVPEYLIPRTLLKNSNELGDSANANRAAIGGVPSYFMIGGLVMVSLSREYLDSEFNTEHMDNFEKWSEEFRILSKINEPKTEHEQEVVLLSQVLAHTCNVGYEQLCNIILSSLNGVKIKSLKHLSVEVNKIFSNSSQSDKNKSLVFEFSNGVVVVIDSDQAKAAQDALCEEHFIPSPCSADLR